MIIRKLITLLLPICLAFSVNLLLSQDDYIYHIFAIGIIILAICLKLVIKEKFFSQAFFYLSILPAILYFAVCLFVLASSSSVLRLIIIFAFALSLWLYFRALLRYYYEPAFYAPKSLEALSTILIMFIVFLMPINFYVFLVLINLSIWQISLILIALVTVLFLQSFWINEIKSEKRYFYLLIANIILLELFWCLSFWPTNFFIVGTIITIGFYLLWEFSKAKLKEIFTAKMAISYLAISAALSLLILLTSTWT